LLVRTLVQLNPPEVFEDFQMPLRAEKNIAVAVESDPIDVAVANAVRRIDVGIRG